ncbi:MAG: hypothetical protein RR209_02145, partial [Angelakisella sp.]
MDYNIDFGIWGSIFPVPTAIADKHLKLCSESQIKVLLLALRDAPNTVDIQYIGKRLGLSPTQVSDALEYWQQAGVFAHSDAPCAAAEVHKAPSAGVRQTQNPADEIIEGGGGQQLTTTHSRGKLTPSQIN